MRALVQRVLEASVEVAGEVVGRTGPGLVVLLGVSRNDTEDEARYIVGKTADLRVFNDEDGKFNLSARDTNAELLVVSQFTLYGDTRKGRRPSFVDAAGPELAQQLYNRTVQLFRDEDFKVATGTFQAHMMVKLTNDGPVTLMLDSSDRQRPRRE